MIAIKLIYEYNRRMEQEMEDKRKDIEKYLSDKSIPLKDRWENYALLPESFAQKGYFTGFSEYDSPYDDFWMDRYEAVSGVELVRRVGPECLGNEFEPEKVERLKEEILQSGCTRFIFDW